MKQILTVLLLSLTVAFANAQDFGYENKLKNDAVTVDQKKELLTLIVSNCLYNGDMQFLVQEKDLQPLAENYTVEAKSMQDLVDHYMQDLAEAETKYDSVEIYQGLKGVYLSMLKFDEAQNTLQFIYNSLDVLLNDTELDSVELAGVYRMAGNYMYEYGQDKASSYPYFTQAIMFDPTDTSSYIFIMLLYTQFGGFDQADSIAQALEQKFPDAFSPYILHTQSVASRMYMENADSVDNLITKCLTDLADLSYLDHLKDAGKGSRQELLYYLMLENMVLLKYYSVLGSDETAEILDCDMNILKDIRRVCLTHDHESTRVPKYTTLNAVAWTYAIDHEFDSSLFYLNKALVEVKKLDAGYSTVTHNIMSSIMAFTFLQGDTLGALKKLEDKLAYSDTIGYLLTDIALLSRLYAMTGDFQNSHKYADFVLNYNPNFYPAWRIKAYADFEAGQPDSVFTYMDKAMQIGKQDFETYLMYGLLYLMQDKPVLAYTYLEAAWYVDPESSILEDVMSELYVRKEE